MFLWQKKQWESLQQARLQQRLPHAILLQGKAGVGKLQFAVALAKSLLCQRSAADGEACGACKSCQLFAGGTHPDYKHIKPQPPKNSTSANPVLSIKVDTIRSLCEQLNTTSQLQGARVAIIEQADKMLHHAANSLLKTLEEPGQNTNIILHTARPDTIPITVRSRCQQVHFPQPSADEALQWLEQQAVSQAAVKLRQAHGAPILACDEDKLDMAGRQTLAQAMLAKTKGESALKFADQLAKLPKYAALNWCLDWVMDVIRLQHSNSDDSLINVASKKQLHAIASRADSSKLFAIYDSICQAIRHEAIALNAQLLWENLLISWDDL